MLLSVRKILFIWHLTLMAHVLINCVQGDKRTKNPC
jgi:hypothetical protein